MSSKKKRLSPLKKIRKFLGIMGTMVETDYIRLSLDNQAALLKGVITLIELQNNMRSQLDESTRKLAELMEAESRHRRLTAKQDGPLIVVNNGMAKSGSTLLAYYTKLLLGHVFPHNGQRALDEAISSGRLGGVAEDSFVTVIDQRALEIISEIASSEGPLVVKTHQDVGPVLINALRDGRIRMTVTQRDPRDMILSGMDHCRDTKATDIASLQDFTSVPDSIVSARWWSQLACNWIDSGLAHIVRYTDLVSMPARELARLSDYLGIPPVAERLDAVIEQELSVRERGRMRFNRGALDRYRKEMSPGDEALCNEELGGLITRLGYHISLHAAIAPVEKTAAAG